MIDFLREGDDIVFDRTVFTSVNDKATQLKQRLTLRFKRFLGEWFLDTTKGMQYVGVMNVKNPSVEVINNMLKAECLKESGVTEIIAWNTNIDPASRTFEILPTTRIRYDTGEITEFGVTL